MKAGAASGSEGWRAAPLFSKIAALLRLLWVSSRGRRLRPWASPYLRWRIETYSGRAAADVTPVWFLRFLCRRRRALLGFLAWAAGMAAAERSRFQP